MATRASQLYRKLLKIQKITFQNDIRMITGARERTRKEFESHANEVDPKAIETCFKTGEDLGKFLLANVAQGDVSNDGVFRVKVEPRHEIRDNPPAKIKDCKNK